MVILIRLFFKNPKKLGFLQKKVCLPPNDYIVLKNILELREDILFTWGGTGMTGGGHRILD